MFQSRAFITAFGLSALWHLFWLLGVYIVVVPPPEKMGKDAKISFLGPLLEKTFFEIIVDEGDNRYTEFRRDVSFDNFGEEYELAVARPMRKNLRQRYTMNVSNNVRRSIRKMLSGLKERPLYEFSYSEKRRVRSNPYTIEGPAGKRILISMPEAPTLEAFIGNREESENLTVAVEFEVDREGRVVAAEPVVSSGDPDVDIKAIRFIKQWVFNPVEAEEDRAHQRGKVAIKIGYSNTKS